MAIITDRREVRGESSERPEPEPGQHCGRGKEGGECSKLVVGPRPPDSRTYAEAAAADDKTNVPEVESTCERSADDVNSDCRGQGQHEPRRRDGDSH